MHIEKHSNVDFTTPKRNGPIPICQMVVIGEVEK